MQINIFCNFLTCCRACCSIYLLLKALYPAFHAWGPNWTEMNKIIFLWNLTILTFTLFNNLFDLGGTHLWRINFQMYNQIMIFFIVLYRSIAIVSKQIDINFNHIEKLSLVNRKASQTTLHVHVFPKFWTLEFWSFLDKYAFVVPSPQHEYIFYHNSIGIEDRNPSARRKSESNTILYNTPYTGTDRFP